jgi:omega-hydroxy-beta-dihydromenaquinone-9 sulfotransferase
MSDDPPKPLVEKVKEAVLMPRFWHGMLFTTWISLCWRNRFAFSFKRIPIVLAVTAFSVGNSFLRWMQERIYGRKAAKTPIKDGPVFIVGHWRSGTTLLHELLVLDRRHNYPTTYQCMAPNHFLITESYVSRWLGFVLPKSRPMDNMTTGWDKPQEDEFALANMGLPTPYLTIAFPNRGLASSEYLDMEGIPPAELERWKEGLVWFLKRVTFGDPRRII